MATEHSTTNITGGHANAVAGGAAGFMSGADKTKLDGVTAGAITTKYYAMWGPLSAPASTSARYSARTNSSTWVNSPETSQYPAPFTGTFTFTLTVKVAVAMPTDSITFTVMVNGVATALTLVLAAGATSGQASASLSVTATDSIAVRLVQSATEANATWNLGMSLVAQG
jgi:hypothetical protein